MRYGLQACYLEAAAVLWFRPHFRFCGRCVHELTRWAVLLQQTSHRVRVRLGSGVGGPSRVARVVDFPEASACRTTFVAAGRPRCADRRVAVDD